MKKLYLLTVLLALAGMVDAQTWEWKWAKMYTNLAYPVPERITRHDDHLLVAGNYGGSSANNDGIFVMAADTAGNTLWTQTMPITGSTNPSLVYTLATDSTHIYVVGKFEGTMQAGSSSVTSAGDFDGFIAALDMNGNPLWVQHYGGTGYDNISDLVVNNGQVYIIASFAGTAAFPPATVTSATSGNNFLLGRIDTSNGDVTWHTEKDINYFDGNLRISSSGDFIVHGNYVGQLNADTVHLTYNATAPGPFLMLLNSSGIAQWAQNLTGYGYYRGFEMELDAANGIYVGIYGGNITGGPRADLDKYGYNASSPTWMYSLSPINNQSYINDIETSGTTVFALGRILESNTANDPNDDTTKLFIASFDAGGTVLWMDTAVHQPMTTSLNAQGFTKGTGNDLYVTGTFRDMVSFDSTTINSPGTDAMYIARIGESTISSLGDQIKAENLNIYPDPSAGSFTISGQLEAGGNVKIIVKNLQGQTVYMEQRQLNTGIPSAIVNIASFRDGIYIAEVVTGDHVYRQKIVLAH